ncbi:MAG TPA: site-2 protease family protein [Paenalcaligenes hominis]|uniref:Site-2 protease family protein n=1 Tax=Paenalcaligenes hominis TaxID=643674 RepID=A0A1U9K285_9BURK|nr:site-2 protease family protein [Paenalcaligenes hominis]AQS52059.1 site-2 protease family protein [Paenalcaligenes hominis]NJB64640.1 Zn-dependent protease [Paenalcaligenes hominis]GGE60185.1 peptidase M50 [Paenalcaligenes hominis]HJH24461.1 site-2 protease family protein [Paenalcaligenes hominis]
MESLIQTIAVYAIPVLFGITLHEAAHGYVARYFGDPTAHEAGRISLNPTRHIDPIGTIVVPLFLLISTKLLGGAGLLFGWAKPVPVNWARLRNPKKHILWVALAGPASNLFMGILWAIALRIQVSLGLDPSDFWARMAIAGVQVNLVLMALNLVPLPPLDGGRIVYSLLPQTYANHYARLEPYGMLILIVLMFTGVLWVILQPFLLFGQTIIRLFL